ncbi:chemotaxis protein CheW [Acuticoccus sp. M5D2P5]|uniref:chemotaxis protein CheW n=1 Tax=Acuticoccus kalidii TaxID=2910977 RepID=UPI001F15E9C5|nr:chemotaxis protein CheW [Acuticoccus kalidii]
MSRQNKVIVDEAEGYVTAKLAGHWFALPISAVHEVFLLTRITTVPQSPPGIIGVLNLRGRLVTAVDTRQILGFSPAANELTMAIGIERQNELFGLAVDQMGDVLRSSSAEREPAPMNLDRRWREIVTGVQRSDGHLVLIVAVDRLFDNVVTLASA